MKENTARKVDALGRISIPKGMRNRFEIENNDELEFFTMRDSGNMYICMRKVATVDEVKEKYAQIANLMEELGLDIPAEVAEQL